MMKMLKGFTGFVGVAGVFFLLGFMVVWTDPQVEVLKVQNINGPAEIVSVKVIEDGEPVEKRPEWLESYGGSYNTTWVSPEYRPSFLTGSEAERIETEKIKAENKEIEAFILSEFGDRVKVTDVTWEVAVD